MARLSSIIKNKHRKKMVDAKEQARKRLKDMIADKQVGFEDRIDAVHRLARMPRNSSKIRVRNRCELTGRARGYYRYFGLSRIELRRLANQGQLPGVVKASW